jgi:hypothetical protein
MSLDAYISDLNALHLDSLNESLDETLTIAEHEEIEWDGPESSSDVYENIYEEWEDDISEIGMETPVDIEENEQQ